MTASTHERIGREKKAAQQALAIHCISAMRHASVGSGIVTREDLVKFRELDAAVDRLEAEFLSMIRA